jgi:hypothetical protein
LEYKEEGHYKDFTSLYPWVNYTCEYPMGHVQSIRSEGENYMKSKLEKRHIFGYVKAIVNPPRGLFYPVLPVKTNKLKFPLCGKCVSLPMDKRPSKCEHSLKERQICGSWTTPEF